VNGTPLTVYGKGSQTRGFLNLRDTLQCVELALLNPAKAGEFRVFNQFTEQFSLNQLADMVQRVGNAHGLNVRVDHIANPRTEQEEHYYNAVHSALPDLGLKPFLLNDDVLDHMLEMAAQNKERIDQEVLLPHVKWKQK
jgi:UDP-sulfoquinovose synthase